ncbi:ECF transporter S component [Vagococcus bubulae]|nr:ECF transporter S component [Vagococcus bubulae]
MKHIRTKDLTMMALLTAFCVVGRLLMAFIPNVQPITATLILVTLYMGSFQAIVISSLSILITNFYLGMGIWTIAQILSFWCVILLVVSLDKLTNLKNNTVLQLIVCMLSGLGYGFLISVMLAPFFGVTNFWAYYVTGVSFDMMHAFGTMSFYILLKKPFVYIINKEVNAKK